MKINEERNLLKARTIIGAEGHIQLNILLCGGDEERKIRTPLDALLANMSQERMKKMMLLLRKKRKN